MMISVVIDTSVWVSSFGNRAAPQMWRSDRANAMLNYLSENKKAFEVCYSERTKHELENNPNLHNLLKYKMLPPHIMNETWDQIELTWNNIASEFGDQSETLLGEHIEELLPDKSNKSNKNDRGIYWDAIQNGCRVILHENPHDFDKFVDDAKLRGIVIINLLSTDCEEVIGLLENILNTV